MLTHEDLADHPAAAAGAAVAAAACDQRRMKTGLSAPTSCSPAGTTAWKRAPASPRRAWPSSASRRWPWPNPASTCRKARPPSASPTPTRTCGTWARS